MAEPQTVYVVILEDRHTDVDVQVYRDRDEAIRAAGVLAEGNARDPSRIVVEEITPAMADDRWVYFATYSSEDDCVRAVERELL